MAKKKQFPALVRGPKSAHLTAPLLFAMMLITGGAGAVSVGGAAARTPVAVTSTFYHWYVMKYRSDHDPMLELRADTRGLVSAALLDEVDAPADDGVSDYDYFLQVEDVIRPCRGLDAAPIETSTGSAEVAVTLDSRAKAPWRLRVSLIKTSGIWQIRHVTRDRTAPSVDAGRRAQSDC